MFPDLTKNCHYIIYFLKKTYTVQVSYKLLHVPLSDDNDLQKYIGECGSSQALDGSLGEANLDP